jgi:hypothetical protein
MNNLLDKFLVWFMLSACGTEGSETEKSLPVFRMDTDGKYALIGDTGSCSESLRNCEFNYRMKDPCIHGSFYLVYVRERYANIWILTHEETSRGSFKWTIKRQSDS